MDKDKLRFRFLGVMLAAALTCAILVGIFTTFKTGFSFGVLSLVIMFALGLMHTFYNRLQGTNSLLIAMMIHIDDEDY